MVLCLIVGCGSKSGRDKGLYFARVPSVVTNQGEEAQKLSEERRSRWISAISRDDLTEEILENDRVCEKHFVSGRAAKSWDKFNIDWVPTLLLGHKKATDRADHKEAAAKRSERARERELVKKPAFEKRERELELERTAKRQKLNEPGEQVSNLSFEGNEDEEKKLTVEAGTQTEEFEYLFSSLNIDRMAGRKFQHLPLRGASLTTFGAFCICLKIFFYLVWLCTICVLLFALVNRTNPRRNKIVHSLMSVILNQVLLSFFL